MMMQRRLQRSVHKDLPGSLESRSREGGWTASPSEAAEGTALQTLPDCERVNLGCVKPPVCGALLRQPWPTPLVYIESQETATHCPHQHCRAEWPPGQPSPTLPPKPWVSSSALFTSWGQQDPVQSLLPSLHFGPQLDSLPGLWAEN